MSDFTINRSECELSAEARDRRETMLEELTGFMRDLHRRRRKRKRAAGAMAVIGALAIAAFVWSNAPHSVPRPKAEHTTQHIIEQPQHEPEPFVPNRVTLIETDPTSLARCRIPAVLSNAIILDDDGLLLTLEQIGRPSGLVRTPSRTWLTGSVTDSLLDKDARAPSTVPHLPST